MTKIRYKKELYAKTALLKAAYNFSSDIYIHLDADEDNYYVTLTPKNDSNHVDVNKFNNEMLAQALRHEVYMETKNVRELMLARAMATTVVAEQDDQDFPDGSDEFSEDDIIKDWFER